MGKQMGIFLWLCYTDFELGFLNAFAIQKSCVSLQIRGHISVFQMSVLAEVFVDKASKTRCF